MAHLLQHEHLPDVHGDFLAAFTENKPALAELTTSGVDTAESMPSVVSTSPVEFPEEQLTETLVEMLWPLLP